MVCNSSKPNDFVHIITMDHSFNHMRPAILYEESGEQSQSIYCYSGEIRNCCQSCPKKDIISMLDVVKARWDCPLYIDGNRHYFADLSQGLEILRLQGAPGNIDRVKNTCFLSNAHSDKKMSHQKRSLSVACQIHNFNRISSGAKFPVVNGLQ